MGEKGFYLHKSTAGAMYACPRKMLDPGVAIELPRWFADLFGDPLESGAWTWVDLDPGKEELPSAAPPANPPAFVMPFGKYKGRTLDDIGSSKRGLEYLDWLLGINLYPETRAAVEAFLKDPSTARDVNEAIADEDVPF